jgi:hypothetical protein
LGKVELLGAIEVINCGGLLEHIKRGQARGISKIKD